MTQTNEREPKYTIRIEQDNYPDNPREADENFGTMVCWHRHYKLGDKHDYSEPSEFLRDIDLKKNILMPLYLYDHSGLSISCSHSYPYNDRWDAGQVGWIYVSHDNVQRAYGEVTPKTTDKAEQCMQIEVSQYDNYG